MIADKIIYTLWWILHPSAHGKYAKIPAFFTPQW